MLTKLWKFLPGCYMDMLYYSDNLKIECYGYYFLYWRIFTKELSTNVVRPSTTIKQPEKAKESIRMNIGDKVIAVGAGRKTKELNGGDLTRNGYRLPGFMGLVVDQKVMTVKEINGAEIRTAYYTFHRDDLHLVDTGRASVPLS